MSVNALRQNEMMRHLLDGLEAGEDIGHYGRLVFVMVGRHFMEEGELVDWLGKNPGVSEEAARGLARQVAARDYNPPRGEKIREWEKEQGFPICPGGEDGACNVYRNLKFPEGVYENIQEFYEEKAS